MSGSRVRPEHSTSVTDGRPWKLPLRMPPAWKWGGGGEGGREDKQVMGGDSSTSCVFEFEWDESNAFGKAEHFFFFKYYFKVLLFQSF